MLCLYPRENGDRCGQCMNCLIDKQQQWKFRLKKELQYNDLAFWVTLTYDDNMLRYSSDDRPKVSKLDCQNYFRQLRKSFNRVGLPVQMKYFLVAEYSPDLHRPHYHCLFLFRFDTPDYTLHQKLVFRQQIFEQIQKSWYHGFAYEKLFHNGVIGYLTKYVFKVAPDYSPPEPTFRLISKGIGVDYLYSLNKSQVFNNAFKTADGYLPRYYRDKLFPSWRSLERIREVKPWQVSEEQVKQSLYVRSRMSDNMDERFNNKLSRFGSPEAFMSYQEQLRQYQLELQKIKTKKRYG